MVGRKEFKPGNGELRLGTNMKLSDDLYSMLFASCIAADYVVAADHRKKVEDQDLQEVYEITQSKMEKKVANKALRARDFSDQHQRDTDETIAYLPAEVEEMTTLLQSRRRTYIMSILAVWLFQIGFASIIIIDAVNAGDLDWAEVPDIKIAMTRFVCGMVLHVQCSGEIQNGLKIMKHSVNHYWKFSNYNTAFLAGFFQVTAMVLITLINYSVITIESTVIDVAKDFTALYIVAEFDNKFSLGPDEKPKKIITES